MYNNISSAKVSREEYLEQFLTKRVKIFGKENEKENNN
jgi:hypothetical protein